MDTTSWPPSLGPDPDDDPQPTRGSQPILTPGDPITAPLASSEQRQPVAPEPPAPEPAPAAADLPAQRAVQPSTPVPAQMSAPATSWAAAELVLAHAVVKHRRKRSKLPLYFAFALVLVLIAVAGAWLSGVIPLHGTGDAGKDSADRSPSAPPRLTLEPGAPAQIYGPVITAADKYYSYPVPSSGEFDTNVLFKGEAPEYETSVASTAGSVVVGREELSVPSPNYDVEQTVIEEVEFLGVVADVRIRKIDGLFAVVVYLENYYGEEGRAVIAFVVLDKSAGVFLRIDASDYPQGEQSEYRLDSWQAVLAAAEEILDLLRIGRPR